MKIDQKFKLLPTVSLCCHIFGNDDDIISNIFWPPNEIKNTSLKSFKHLIKINVFLYFNKWTLKPPPRFSSNNHPFLEPQMKNTTR